MATLPLVRKKAAYFGRCVICQEGHYVYIIEHHHTKYEEYPGVYNRHLLCKDSKGSVAFAIICDKEECFNMWLIRRGGSMSATEQYLEDWNRRFVKDKKDYR